jgi:DNA topoisomerase-1
MRGLDMLKGAVGMMLPHTYRERRRVKSGWRYFYDKFKAPYVQPTKAEAPKPKPKGKAVFVHNIRIAPAYEIVWQAPNADAELVAIVKDKKGRSQYLYSQAHWSRVSAEKFERAKAFQEARPVLAAKILEALKAKDPQTRQCAECLYLISKAAIRIGSTKDTKAEKRAYGASTLENRHATVNGEDVTLSFIAKKGVAVKMTLKDPILAGIIAKRRGKPDERIWPLVSGKLVNEMLGHWHKAHCTVKDFRTAIGTETAVEAMRTMRKPKTKKAKKQAIRAVCEVVAKRLGNTWSVARASYIE